MTERELIQIEATKAYVDNNKHGTLVIPTGVGKTKVACDIAGKQMEYGVISTVLVVVPTTNLMSQWYDEFCKWGYDTKNITFMCIQSACKQNLSVDLMIVDEVHTSLSPVYSAIYHKVKRTQTLGLTATLPEDKEARELLQAACPVVYTKTLKEVASVEGIIAKTTTYNLPVKFNRKDKAKYNTFNEQFHRATMNIAMIKRDREELKNINVFDIAKEYATKKNVAKEDEMLQKHCKAYWNAMTMRKWLCYNAESKIPIVKDILEKYPQRKWILFNKSIKFAEVLQTQISSSKVYHSKLKDDERELILKEFSEGAFKYLIAVDALNAGLNVPDIDSGLCISGVSTELVAVQQAGRVGRYKENKEALFINLYGDDTVEKSWVQSKTKNLPNVRWIESSNQIT